MKLNYLLAAALIVGFAGAAVAEQNKFFIVQDKDKNCRIIEGKADVVDNQTVKVGKESYPSREEAEVDIKVVCVNP
jgi:pyruvate/2-oxoglutarate dehydrogenase complex dihydrolipoamide dehydrogenase (E3) component